MLHSPPVKAAGSKKKKAADGLVSKAPTSTRIPFSALFRMFAIGAVGVVASGYALYRYYFVPRPPMLVPAAASSAAGTSGAPPAATELPAPELEPLKDHP